MTIHQLPTIQRLRKLRAYCTIDDEIRGDMDAMETLASEVFKIFSHVAKRDLSVLVDMADTSFVGIPREPEGIEKTDLLFKYAMVWTPLSRAVEFMGGPKDGDKPLVLPEGDLFRPVRLPTMNRPYERFGADDNESVPISGMGEVTYDYYGFNDTSRNWVYRIAR